MTNNLKLPDFFKPIVWSHDIARIDPEKHRKLLIVNAINYGDLRHWRWILGYYGKDAIQETMANVAASELRARVRKLASLVFSLPEPNYASRSTSRTR